MEVDIEDPSLFSVEINREPNNSFVKLYVPHNISRDFKDVKLRMRNQLTGQLEEILLSYTDKKEEEVQRVFWGLMKRDTLVDLVTLVILLVTIAVLYNYISSDVNYYFYF